METSNTGIMDQGDRTFNSTNEVEPHRVIIVGGGAWNTPSKEILVNDPNLDYWEAKRAAQQEKRRKAGEAFFKEVTIARPVNLHAANPAKKLLSGRRSHWLS